MSIPPLLYDTDIGSVQLYSLRYIFRLFPLSGPKQYLMLYIMTPSPSGYGSNEFLSSLMSAPSKLTNTFIIFVTQI